MKDLNFAKEMLLNNEYTCVICKDETVYTSTFRGVKPLVQWLDRNLDVKGYFAADKVIGRATAFLYVLLEVQEVYAHVISKPALAVLEAHGVQVQYGTLVENIINRAGTGICPFEETVMGIEDPQNAYTAIRNKMKEMNITL